MNAIEFQTVVHDGVLHIPTDHRRQLDGKAVLVVLRDAPEDHGDEEPTLFARLRRVRIKGPADLSTNHDAYVTGTPDE